MYSVYNELGYGEVMRYIKSRLAEGSGVVAASPLGVSVDECDVKGCIGPVSSRSASSSGGSPPPVGGSSSVSSISPVQFPTNGRTSTTTQQPPPPPFPEDFDDLRDFLLPPPPPPPPLPSADSSLSSTSGNGRGYATLSTSNLSHLNCRVFGGPHSPASSSDAVSQICVIGSPSVGSDSGFQGEEDSVSNLAVSDVQSVVAVSSSSSFPFDEVTSSTQPSVRIVFNDGAQNVPAATEEEEEFIDVEAVEPEAVEADSTTELKADGFPNAQSPDTTAAEWTEETPAAETAATEPLLQTAITAPHRKSALITPIRLRLDSASDLDSTLSPNSAFSPISAKSVRSPRKFRSSALHSPTDAPETPTLSAKTRRVTHEIEASRRRVLKYVANNLRSAALLMHWQRRIREAEERRQSEAAAFRPNLEDPADDPAFGVLCEIPTIRPQPKPRPQPLNLYPNGDAKVFPNSKIDAKIEKEMLEAKSRSDEAISEQIAAHREAENRLMSVLLIPLKPRPAEAPLSGVSVSTESTEMKVPIESENRTAKQLEQLLAEAQRPIPRLGGVGRHTMAKYRSLFRAELSTGNAWQQSTQLERIRERRLREQQKQDDAARKRQQLRSKRPPHSASRRRGAASKRCSAAAALNVTPLQRKPSAAGPILKRHSSGSMGFRRSTKSSTSTAATPTTATPTSALLTPTTALFPNIAALARDPTFDSFLTPPAEATSPGDPYAFAETAAATEDPFHRAATQLFALAQQLRRGSVDETPTTTPQPKKRGRKPSADGQRKTRRPSNASSGQTKPKRSRKTRELNNNTIGPFVETDAAKSEGMLVYTAETEEPCAFGRCSLPRVLVVTGAEPTEWVQCDLCDEWFHCVCVWGVNRAVGEDEKFQCEVCRH